MMKLPLSRQTISETAANSLIKPGQERAANNPAMLP
jgi:hypothetical protein